MGNHSEKCNRCGRALKTEKSQKVGFGPVCLRKYEAEKSESEARQIEQKG